MNNYQKSKILEIIVSQENFPSIREQAKNICDSESVENCYQYSLEFYKSEKFQVQELAVFIFGYISDRETKALDFLKSEVSKNEDWRVQEILAMAFNEFCKNNGYEKSLPTIRQWLNNKIANVRRAVTEGLRIWTNKPYFKENPLVAIKLLSSLKQDESEYVRKSVGNALRDISKKYPDLILDELQKWDTTSKQVMQVYKLAIKFIYKQ